MPANFPKDRDLIWTVTANGVTQKAFGSLWPVWEVDQGTISANRGSRTAVDFDEPPNAAPQVVNPPPKQVAEVGKPLSLTLEVSDDGNPRPRVDRGASVAGPTCADGNAFFSEAHGNVVTDSTALDAEGLGVACAKM